MEKIERFPNYFVAKNGNVYSKAKGKLLKLKPWTRKDGYLCVTLSNKGKREKHTVQSLVLRAFIGICPNGKEICHNNGIRIDNRLTNLRYDTRAGNFADKLKHGTDNRGSKHPLSKLNEWQARIINRCKNTPNSFLGKIFGVNEETCGDIKRGNHRLHVTSKQVWLS